MWVAKATYLGQNCFQVATGSSAQLGLNLTITKSDGYSPVTAGNIFTFSAFFDPYSIDGSFCVIVMNAQSGLEITRVTSTGHTVAQRIASTFTVPSGCSSVYYFIQSNATNATSTMFTGQFQLERGSVMTVYKPNTTNHGSKGFTNSTPFNLQGSLLNYSGTPSITYTSTATSITVTIPATTLTFTDNTTTISVPQLVTVFNGLTATTTYYAAIAVNIATSTYVLNTGGANTKISANLIQTFCYRDGLIAIYANLPCSTTAVGAQGGNNTTSPGSGGPSCPATYQLVETLEHGFIRADEVDIGMHLPGGDPLTWVRVNDATRMPTELWRYTITDDIVIESFDVNDTHASKTLDGEWLKVCDMKPGDKLMGVHGNMKVVSAEPIGQGYYIGFDVEGHEFSMGRDCVHNIITL